MKLIGHHACSREGDLALILKEGLPPAYSDYNSEYQSAERKSRGNPFLGSGFYFWDYNLEMANYWGRTHYKNKYYVFQADLIFTEDSCQLFDIVGNRQHLELLLAYMEEFKEQNPNKSKTSWYVSDLIEMLKKINEEEPGTFPFAGVRAIDHSVLKNDVKHYFSLENPKFTCLNPTFIVCVYSNPQKIIQNLQLISE